MANNYCQCNTCTEPCETCKAAEKIAQCCCGTCNPDCLPPKSITVMGGTELTLDEAKVALEEAMKVIECVGTTGIYRQYERADKWMKKYFPNWAD